MDPLWIGLISIAALILVCAMGIHVAFSLMLVAGGGFIILVNPETLYGFARMTAVQWSYNFSLAVIPLFMLMGYVFGESGVAPEVFYACRAWFGRLPGGLAVATTFANGAFGAMSGSSLAAVAMFNRLAFPEMWKAGYDKRLCAGVITVTGTLAGIIPPSITIVLVGMLTDISIGQLLLAGYFTGINEPDANGNFLTHLDLPGIDIQAAQFKVS